jgi:hypothetical protein
MATTRAVHLLDRPHGAPSADLFELVEFELPALEPGQVLVHNQLLSVDPYMRQLMDGSWPLREPLSRGRAIGVVAESRSAKFREGDHVFHSGGWRSAVVLDEDTVGLRAFTPHPDVPLESYLSVLGGTGLTAYAGIKEILGVGDGDTVFLTSIAGAVGVAAAQIARQLGAKTVLGTASTDAKVAHVVDELGVDAALNYRTGDLDEFLAEHARDGLTATLDGVGGDALESAIRASADHARIALVGAISQYNNEGRPWRPPANFEDLHFKSITLRGYAVRDYGSLRVELEEWLIPRLVDGSVKDAVQVTDGFDHLIEAFLGMLNSANLGKALVRVNPAGS